MKAVLQRVKEANLKVDGKEISAIDKGLVVYFGVEKGDDETIMQKMCKKIASMRIFEDENGKMNLSVKDIGGQILLVSQFTLLADCSKGNRPNFLQAEEYQKARDCLQDEGILVKLGVFGADMKIYQLNDGPVTIILDSKILKI